MDSGKHQREKYLTSVGANIKITSDSSETMQARQSGVKHLVFKGKSTNLEFPILKHDPSEIKTLLGRKKNSRQLVTSRIALLKVSRKNSSKKNKII